MKILGIIPARSGSKGIPGKNIKLLGDKPLIAHTIIPALSSTLLDKLIISTDSREIANIAKQYGAEVPFIRPKELAKDDTPSIEVVKHALNYFANQGINYDAVCLLQPTTPIRPASFIDMAVKKFILSEADSLVSVREVPHEYNPHWVFKENENGFLYISTGDKKIIPRRQELPKAFFRDGSIYLATNKTIYNKNSLLGEQLAYILTPDEIPYINLDTHNDWEKAEKFFN